MTLSKITQDKAVMKASADAVTFTSLTLGDLFYHEGHFWVKVGMWSGKDLLGRYGCCNFKDADHDGYIFGVFVEKEE